MTCCPECFNHRSTQITSKGAIVKQPKHSLFATYYCSYCCIDYKGYEMLKNVDVTPKKLLHLGSYLVAAGIISYSLFKDDIGEDPNINQYGYESLSPEMKAIYAPYIAASPLWDTDEKSISEVQSIE